MNMKSRSNDEKNKFKHLILPKNRFVNNNFNIREKELRKYASLDMELRTITNKKEKMEKFEELMRLSELLGLSDNEEN